MAVGAAALQRNDAKVSLKSLLKDGTDAVMTYMKNLSPSGVELEILMLGNFDFESEEAPTEAVSKFLDILLQTIEQKRDCDYT
jgi:hypothetical protein